MRNKKVKIFLLFIFLLLLAFVLLNMFTSYLSIQHSVQRSMANQNVISAKSISNSLDKEAYKHFLKTRVKNQEYKDIQNYLEQARENIGALHVYTLEVDNPIKSRVMIASLSEGFKDEDIAIGMPCTVPEKQVRRAYEGKTFITNILNDPVYGEYMTVGVPIKDDNGTVIGALGIDVSAESIHAISDKVIKSSTFNLIYSGAFVIILVFAFIFIQKWYRKEMKREVVDTEDTYRTEFQSLIASVRSLRHDFSNHVQVVHGLLKLEESAKALEYLTSLSKEVHSIESMELDVTHPGLSVLLETKRLSAQNYNIDIRLDISPDSFDTIKTTDLIKLLSNVIDNAIEATTELPEQDRRMNIACKTVEGKYMFAVTNTGPMIPLVDQENIFISGYSTKKKEKGKERGQGLFIVKDLVRRYNGEIFVDSNDNETSVTVLIPVE
ncbi:sensor histidine kinase [Peribacillus sp. NPDC097295]|uniref:sensor histidine kinase n=1 Tax=Peribacillus sp. NPDC097295 TaxID=3364402 RepID=UPI0038065452